MKIDKIDVFPVSIPYKSAYGISTLSTPEGKHVIVKVYTDEGIIGLGEAALIYIERTGETQEGIVFALERYLGPALIGEDPFNIDGIMAKLEKLTLGDFTFRFSITAVDHALYDIMGKALNVPVYKLLGGCSRKTMGVSRSIPIKSPEEMGDAAVSVKEQGYKMVTVKIGVDPKEDIKRVAAVRKAVGDDFPMEVDANQGYATHIALPTLRKMEEFGLESIEQPVPWWDLDGMAKLTTSLDTPVIADESVLSPVDAMNIVKKYAADILCIKLATSGGFYYGKKIAAIAEAGGLGVSMASRHTFGVGTAAIHHFVAATQVVQEPIGYGSPHERLEDDIITEPIPFEKGVATVLEGPGLGVVLDEAKLKKFSVTLTVQ